MPKLLNVGGGPVAVPAEYQGYDVDLLDIDIDLHPEIWLDARKIATDLEPAQYDVVLCSHNLEHYYEHEVPGVLWGFYHVLKMDGFADIRVPDVLAVMNAVVQHNLGLRDVLYQSAVGPIRVLDVLWGWQKQIARSSYNYYAHKIGFSQDMLGRLLKEAHFERVMIASKNYEIRALAYKRIPKENE